VTFVQVAARLGRWIFPRRRPRFEAARAKALAGVSGYLVLPAPPDHRPSEQLAGCARELLARLEQRAESLGCGARPLAVAPDGASLWSWHHGRAVSLPELFADRPLLLLANASFWLEPHPPAAALAQVAREGALAIRASDSSRALHAVALSRSLANQADCRHALAQLAFWGGEQAGRCWSRRSHVQLVPSPAGSVDQAPSAAGLTDPRSLCAPFAPRHLNTALAEVLYDPADPGAVDGSPERLRRALLAQRDRSAVPWVFNTLVNEIEYRLGRPILDSFPPELHLSVTGRCNIECRFCSYAHETAHGDFVTVAQVARLDFLRHLHTLRLSSGLGEPTLNPHLPGLIDYLADRFPHLALNFFTNGTALQRRGLIDALVHRLAWVNVSLNAATSATWKALCGRNLFEGLVAGLRELHQAKRSRGSLRPLVYGSMVLTRTNLHELPRMPELCRALGVDRFTAIPFFSYGYADPKRYGAGESFHACRDRYDVLYQETVRQAQAHRVSVELPLPGDRTQAVFGLEVRPLYDFAGIEEVPPSLGLLVPPVDSPPRAAQHCREIWQIAYVGSTNRTHVVPTSAHFLYPCLGPLGAVDFSSSLGFDFPDSPGFLRLWNHPLLVKLRTAQRCPGLSRVCDTCRGLDSRDPNNFAALHSLLGEWQPTPTFVPAEQLTLRRA
jgi:molybdenum cofactor biosynthesis enzyme MoaA